MTVATADNQADVHSTQLVKPLRRAARRRLRGTWFLWLLPVAVGVFLYAPVAIVALFAFNSSRSLFVFDHFSLHWFDALIHDQTLLASVRASFEIAAVTVLIAVPLGVALGLALGRGGRAVRGPGNGLILLCIITPEIALAFALLMAFTNLHVQLSLWVIVAGHVTFAIPYVALITRARLAMLNQQLEEAAMDLGATALKAIWTVVIPLLSPAIMGAAMLIFVFSFDDFTTSLFLSGVNVSPLPVTIFSMIRFGVSPEVNAFAVLVILFSVSLGIGSIVLARWRGAK